MLIRLRCKRAAAPAAEYVRPVHASFVNAESFSVVDIAPNVGNLGVAVIEVDPENAADAALIKALNCNPANVKFVMTTDGWSLGHAIVDKSSIVIEAGSDNPYQRAIASADFSKGGPSLKRANTTAFFKTI